MTINAMNEETGKRIFNNQNISVGIVFFLLGLSFIAWTSRTADIQQKLNLSDGQLGSALFAMLVFLSGLFYSTVNVSMNTQGTLAEQNVIKLYCLFFQGIWSVTGFTGRHAGTLLTKKEYRP